jgi:hypothetical protein
MIRCRDGELAEALKLASLPPDALVFVASSEVSDEWASVAAELKEAFDQTQVATRAGGPVVYVVDGDDLLGRNGVGGAMVANGLLSAARTLALETARSGVPANVLAVDAATPPESVGLWVELLCRLNGPTGDVVHLDVAHRGKALS